MKSKTFHFLIPLFLLPLLSLSQPINTLVGDVQMKPAGISSLSRYQDIPVSFFTGVPNISIPIYEIAEGTISLPLNLSYHSSGVRVAETSSNIGLSWDIGAGGGGFVSRTTQGIPDDRSAGYYWQGAPPDPCDMTVCMEGVPCNTVDQAINGQLDGEPDIFSFQIAGMYSGKMFFSPSGVPVLVPNQDIIIEPITGDVSSQNEDGIRGWKFIAPNGAKYYFGGFASTPTADLAVDELQVNGNKELSTWYLIKVESYDSEYKINLSYIDEAYSYKTPATCQRIITECQNQNGQGNGSEFRCLGFNGTADYHINRVNGQRLSSITSSTCTIDFIAENDRIDLDPYQDGLTALPNALDTIKITTGDYCKAFVFYHSYFETTSPTESEDYRLRLDSLQEVACDGSVFVTPYTFEYNSQRLPSRLSKAIDHWGFYNGSVGNDGNSLNIPYTEVELGNGSVKSVGDSNREPNANFGDAGILEQINYPEGGFAHFDYEGHEYYDDEITQSTNKIFVLSGLSNCTVPDASCCTNQNAMAIDSFSQAEIDEGRFSLAVTDVSASGAMTCNSTTTEIILKVFNDATNAIVGSVGYNVTAGQNGYQEYDWDIFPLVAGTFYRIELEVDGAKGEFNLWRNQIVFNVAGNMPVGGLRIQQMTVHDGIDVANDIIKTYEYSSSFDPNQSSGALFKMPQYGFPISLVQPTYFTYVALFSSTSITPISDFDGYHIGYERVEEKHNGNGTTIYNYRTEIASSSGNPSISYPQAPTFATVRNGKLLSVGQFRENGTQVALTSNTQHAPTSGYTFYDDVMFKVQDIPTPECPDLYAIQCYSMRTGQYLLGSVQSNIDGVTTTTTYEYDNDLDHLAPTVERKTNSDGKEYKTSYQYPFDKAAFTVYNNMIDSNIIAMPCEVTTEVIEGGNATLISGTTTECLPSS